MEEGSFSEAREGTQTLVSDAAIVEVTGEAKKRPALTALYPGCGLKASVVQVVTNDHTSAFGSQLQSANALKTNVKFAKVEDALAAGEADMRVFVVDYSKPFCQSTIDAMNEAMNEFPDKIMCAVVLNADLGGAKKRSERAAYTPEFFTPYFYCHQFVELCSCTIMARSGDEGAVRAFMTNYMLGENDQWGDVLASVVPFPRLGCFSITNGSSIASDEKVIEAVCFGLSSEQVSKVPTVGFATPLAVAGSAPFIMKSGSAVADMLKGFAERVQTESEIAWNKLSEEEKEEREDEGGEGPPMPEEIVLQEGGTAHAPMEFVESESNVNDLIAEICMYEDWAPCDDEEFEEEA